MKESKESEHGRQRQEKEREREGKDNLLIKEVERMEGKGKEEGGQGREDRWRGKERDKWMEEMKAIKIGEEIR